MSAVVEWFGKNYCSKFIKFLSARIAYFINSTLYTDTRTHARMHTHINICIYISILGVHLDAQLLLMNLELHVEDWHCSPYWDVMVQHLIVLEASSATIANNHNSEMGVGNKWYRLHLMFMISHSCHNFSSICIHVIHVYASIH